MIGFLKNKAVETFLERKIIQAKIFYLFLALGIITKGGEKRKNEIKSSGKGKSDDGNKPL